MKLSRETHTGIDYWISLTIFDFKMWIDSYNKLKEKEKQSSEE